MFYYMIICTLLAVWACCKCAMIFYATFKLSIADSALAKHVSTDTSRWIAKIGRRDSGTDSTYNQMFPKCAIVAGQKPVDTPFYLCMAATVCIGGVTVLLIPFRAWQDNILDKLMFGVCFTIFVVGAVAMFILYCMDDYEVKTFETGNYTIPGDAELNWPKYVYSFGKLLSKSSVAKEYNKLFDMMNARNGSYYEKINYYVDHLSHVYVEKGITGIAEDILKEDEGAFCDQRKEIRNLVTTQGLWAAYTKLWYYSGKRLSDPNSKEFVEKVPPTFANSSDIRKIFSADLCAALSIVRQI